MSFFSGLGGALVSGGASILGGVLGRRSQESQSQAMIDAQREFAQQGIRWKVADAKAAGIHPLYALGANTHSFAPFSVGADPLAAGIAGMGQSIGDLIRGTTADEQQERLNELRIEGEELNNMQKQVELEQMRKKDVSSNPMPDGTAAAPEVSSGKLEVVGTSPKQPIVVDRSGPKVTLPGDVNIDTTSGRLQQQTVEDMYGGVIGELYGSGWAFNDIVKHLGRKYRLPLSIARIEVNQWLKNKKKTPAQQRVYDNLYRSLQRR